MKRMRVLLLPPGWDASPSQGYPQHYVAGTHLCTWVERDNMEQSLSTKETTRWQRPDSNHQPSGWKSDVLTARPPCLCYVYQSTNHFCFYSNRKEKIDCFGWKQQVRWQILLRGYFVISWLPVCHDIALEACRGKNHPARKKMWLIITQNHCTSKSFQIHVHMCAQFMKDKGQIPLRTSHDLHWENKTCRLKRSILNSIIHFQST